MSHCWSCNTLSQHFLCLRLLKSKKQIHFNIQGFSSTSDMPSPEQDTVPSNGYGLVSATQGKGLR